MLRVSGEISQKTGFAPRSTKAFALDTKVYEGTMTSSPAEISHSIAAMSSEAVQELVKSAALAPAIAEIFSSQIFMNLPSP